MINSVNNLQFFSLTYLINLKVTVCTILTVESSCFKCPWSTGTAFC